MFIETVVAAALMQSVQPAREFPVEDIRLTATLLADRIQVGETYEIEVSLELGDGWTTSDVGIPMPLLQIDVPESVRLSGKVLKSYRELSRNEFLNEPFERQFEGDSTTVGFTIKGELSDGDMIGLNMVIYAKHEDGRVRFVRRRVDLPIKANATASTGECADRSNWGRKTGQDTGLQIGDQASAFDLPRADGSRVRLDDYLGKSNIIVTTYRAYW